ncbi:MAG: anti-sigma factor family protein [Dermatophilaceae bacterium]
MNTDEFALYDAAYVLGALAPAERREFEDHLKGCAACASSVGELAGLPGLMSRVSVEELTAEVEVPPQTLLSSLARAVRRERARRRLAVGTAAVAAACLVAVGTVALSGQDSPARQPLAPSASISSTASGSSTLRSRRRFDLVDASISSGTANLALSAVVPSPVTASARLVDMAWAPAST